MLERGAPGPSVPGAPSAGCLPSLAPPFAPALADPRRAVEAAVLALAGLPVLWADLGVRGNVSGSWWRLLAILTVGLVAIPVQSGQHPHRQPVLGEFCEIAGLSVP